ncbi:helix-turn-helix domain-containing protein [Cellulomonas sp.]|uniref:winged helix-turn-helix domain-containing protein n=1 Tax=Cellulomonas sp. TaxID=40001 RepID=UPI0028120C41|nr:helix-turn-helix domain-containing protein [Cellulomonas sp.]
MTQDKTPLGTEALKAFAHPLRMAMYAALRDDGPATASMLARRFGESSGQTSYHLRQLERHGFVEDDPDRPGSRERWWRSRGFSLDVRDLLEDPDAAPAAHALLDDVVAERARTLSARVEERPTRPWSPEMTLTSTLRLTQDEAAELVERGQALVEEYRARAAERIDAGDLAGRHRVRVYLDVLALPAAAGGDVPEAPGAPPAG